MRSSIHLVLSDGARAVQIDHTERPQPAVGLPRKVAIALGLLAGAADEAPAPLFVRAMCPAQCCSCAACSAATPTRA